MILSNFDAVSSPSSMPEQDLSKEEMEKYYTSEEEWYARCVRYIAGRYNAPRFGSYYAGMPQNKIHGSKTGNANSKGPVEEMIENYLYFHGDQPNDAYKFMLQDPISGLMGAGQGGDILIPTPWEQGNDIYTLITHLIGTFESRVSFAKLTVDNNTREGRKQKDIDRQLLFLYSFMKKSGALEKLSNAGVDFNPFPELENVEMEQAVEYLENKPQEKEVFSLMQDVMFRNDTRNLLKKVFAYVIINRIGAIHVKENEEGYPMQHVVPPQNVIVDQVGDEDFSVNDRFCGYIEFLSPEEIFVKYGIKDDEERSAIRAMSRGGSYGGMDKFALFNSTEGYFFPWWWKQGENKVACVTTYWKSYTKKKKGDLYRSILGKDFKNMNLNIPDDDSFEYEICRQGTLIGNGVLVDYGVTKNIVRNPYDKKKVVLPILSVRPYTMMGYNRSIVDRLRQIQDKIDALEAKITDSITHDFGNVYVFVSDKLTADPMVFASDIKKNRFTFIQRADGEDLSSEDNRTIMERMDMNLSSNIMNYVQLKRTKREEMETVASISKIALGQQSSYVGMNTQVNTIQQNSKGVEKYLSSCLQLGADVMQYSVEKLKMSLVGNKDLEREVLTPLGIEYLKLNKNLSFMDLGVRLIVEDMISEESRMRLLGIAQAFAQNQQISPLDVIEIETAKTYTELRNYLKAALRRQEKKAAAEAMMQQMAQQQAIEAQGQQLMQLESMKQQGQNERQANDIELEGTRLGMEAGERMMGMQ
jgi:hypothetical protein